ncbi:MAG: IS3 family transposase, partial [Rhabdochlamydiaceae bacterium]
YPSIGFGKICRLFGMTRQAYYKQMKKEDKLYMQEAVILKLVEDVRHKLPHTGTRKLIHMLAPSFELHHIRIGRDKLFDTLSIHGLLIRKRKRKYPKTTDSYHRFRKYTNLIKGMDIVRPEQVWVSDITYLTLPEGFCYLNLVTDAYSRKIMGYCLYSTLETTGTLMALNMALANRQRPKDVLIHHSDRGTQYCCAEYVKLLTEHHIGISMAKSENPIAERVNGILKAELGLDETFKNVAYARKIVAERIKVYNQLRIHASCDYLTPQQAHDKEGALAKKWKNYRKRKNNMYLQSVNQNKD